MYYGSTKGIRIAADLAEKLGAIVWYCPDATIAAILDPLIRKFIEKRFGSLPPDIQRRATSRLAESQTPAVAGD